LAFALLSPVPLAPPRIASVGAQAVVGATVGAYFDPTTLASVGEHWAAVSLVVAATLGVSLAAGLLVAELTGLDRPTALLGLVAGGASGIVTMSRELGGDDRLVAFMQYLRVLVVVLLAPLLVALALSDPGGGGSTPPRAGEHPGVIADMAFTVAACAAGLLAARRVRIPAGALLASLTVAATLTGSGAANGAEVPAMVENLAFAVIGVQVGLRFTSNELRSARRLLPAALGAILGVVAVCAALAFPLAVLARVSYLDAYLATTPGGIHAVLATAVDSGADTTFVLAVQTLRLLIMVVAAPPLVRVLANRRLPNDHGSFGSDRLHRSPNRQDHS
jgi:membrane AbrB-like protein